MPSLEPLAVPLLLGPAPGSDAVWPSVSLIFWAFNISWSQGICLGAGKWKMKKVKNILYL